MPYLMVATTAGRGGAWRGERGSERVISKRDLSCKRRVHRPLAAVLMEKGESTTRRRGRGRGGGRSATVLLNPVIIQSNLTIGWATLRGVLTSGPTSVIDRAIIWGGPRPLHPQAVPVRHAPPQPSTDHELPTRVNLANSGVISCVCACALPIIIPGLH